MDVLKDTDGRSLLQEAVPLVKEFMRADPWIYWKDYLFCTLLGWTAFAMALDQSAAIWLRGLWLAVAGLSLYRSVLFIHEISHLKKDAVPFFRPVWNLFTGVPLLIPSFFYEGVHLTHHRKNVYGTPGDGEYMPFVKNGRLSIVTFLFSNLLFPPLLVFRHLVLTPLSFFSPSIRRWTWAHFSSLEIDISYVRPLPEAGEMPVVTQALAFVVCTGAGLALYFGKLSPQFLVTWYAMAAFILGINAIRTLAAHRYSHLADQPMDIVQQYQDSIDIPGNLLTPLWAPVGLQFHATHHLFPAMPYHNLKRAHLRLNESLVKNNEVYKRAVRPSLRIALTELWVAAGKPSPQTLGDGQIVGYQTATDKS